MNPFAILGLESEANERDIKRAYARLLKEHRPDQDPEGFQRIRQAYEAATEQLKWRDVLQPHQGQDAEDALFQESDEAALDPFPQQPTHEGTTAPSCNLLDAVLVNDKAIALPLLEQALKKYLANQHTEEDLFEIIPAIPAAWFDSLPESLLTTDHLINELEQNRSVFSTALIQAWAASEEFDPLLQVGKAWLAHQNRLHNQAATQFGMSIATLLSIYHFDLAKKIADACFSFAPPGVHDFEQDNLDHLLLIGESMQATATKKRIFWTQVLVHGASVEWNTGMALAQLEALENLNNHPVIDAIYARIGVVRQHRVPSRKRADRSEGGFSWWIVWAIFIAIKGVAMMSLDGCERSTYNQSYNSNLQGYPSQVNPNLLNLYPDARTSWSNAVPFNPHGLADDPKSLEGLLQNLEAHRGPVFSPTNDATRQYKTIKGRDDYPLGTPLLSDPNKGLAPPESRMPVPTPHSPRPYP